MAQNPEDLSVAGPEPSPSYLTSGTTTDISKHLLKSFYRLGDIMKYKSMQWWDTEVLKRYVGLKLTPRGLRPQSPMAVYVHKMLPGVDGAHQRDNVCSHPAKV